MISPINRPPDDRPHNERRTVRERTFLPARITFGESGAISTDGTITQMSAIGARLNISASVALPDRFGIAISQRGLTFRARLVWRRDDQAGVEFYSEDKEGAQTLEELRAKVRELEDANAKLRARVSDLVLQVTRLTES